MARRLGAALHWRWHQGGAGCAGRHAAETVREAIAMVVLEAINLSKVYGGRGQPPARALHGCCFTVERGACVGVRGPSGSGQATLLSLLATLDTPTSGTVRTEGVDAAKLKGDKLARFRRQRLGFVFQGSNLLDTRT